MAQAPLVGARGNGGRSSAANSQDESDEDIVPVCAEEVRQAAATDALAQAVGNTDLEKAHSAIAKVLKAWQVKADGYSEAGGDPANVETNKEA